METLEVIELGLAAAFVFVSLVVIVAAFLLAREYKKDKNHEILKEGIVFKKEMEALPGFINYRIGFNAFSIKENKWISNTNLVSKEEYNKINIGDSYKIEMPDVMEKIY